MQAICCFPEIRLGAGDPRDWWQGRHGCVWKKYWWLIEEYMQRPEDYDVLCDQARGQRHKERLERQHRWNLGATARVSEEAQLVSSSSDLHFALPTAILLQETLYFAPAKWPFVLDVGTLERPTLSWCSLHPSYTIKAYLGWWMVTEHDNKGYGSGTNPWVNCPVFLRAPFRAVERTYWDAAIAR